MIPGRRLAVIALASPLLALAVGAALWRLTADPPPDSLHRATPEARPEVISHATDIQMAFLMLSFREEFPALYARSIGDEGRAEAKAGKDYAAKATAILAPIIATNARPRIEAVIASLALPGDTHDSLMTRLRYQADKLVDATAFEVMMGSDELDAAAPALEREGLPLPPGLRRPIAR
jgi:hypothetical protein